MIILKHDGSELGFCRIQYKAANGAKYCLQDEGNGAFIFYRCAGDYEPSHAVNVAAFSIARHASEMPGDIEFLEAAGCFLFHDLLAVTKEYLAARPAFRSMPVGAPYSPARLEQNQAIESEDKAIALISAAEAFQ